MYQTPGNGWLSGTDFKVLNHLNLNKMLILASFDVIKPDPGLIFWTSLVFITLWIVVGKMAFKPIANALKTRENDIQDALNAAEVAKAELSNLKSENEKLLQEARAEKTRILSEAKEISDKMIRESKEKAKEEANKIAQQARVEIESQKRAALEDMKNQVASFAIEISEQILRKELSDKSAQKELVTSLVKDIKLN